MTEAIQLQGPNHDEDDLFCLKVASGRAVQALGQVSDVSRDLIWSVDDAEDDTDVDLKADKQECLALVPFQSLDASEGFRQTLDRFIVLRRGGHDGTELFVGLLHPPRLRRPRNAASFQKYDSFKGYASKEAITRSGLQRKAAENDLRDQEGRGDEGETGSSIQPSWTFPEIVLHRFPTRILSIKVASSAQSFGRSHSSTWLCIRTIASTLFTSIKVPQRSLWKGDNLRLISLSGLLEIMHGEAVLSSGVKGHKNVRTRERQNTKTVRSAMPIVDAAFHPHRHDIALTIDAAGALGRFECDQFTVLEVGWVRSLSWTCIFANPDEEKCRSLWTIDWSLDEYACLVWHECGAWSVDLSSGERRGVYLPPEGVKLVSLSTGKQPHPLIWIASSSEVLVLDGRTDFISQQLTSCLHYRANSGALHIHAVESYPRYSMAILSSRQDRVLSTFVLDVADTASIGSWVGEPGLLRTSALSSEKLPMHAPTLINVNNLSKDWLRSLQHTMDPEEGLATFMILERSSDGGLWLTGACAGEISDSMISREPKGDQLVHHQRQKRVPLDGLSLRTVHTFGDFYNVLFDNGRIGTFDPTLTRQVHQLMDNATAWLQKAEAPMSTMLLPRDILSRCQREILTERQPSICQLFPAPALLLPDAYRRIEDLLESAEHDAWSAGLQQILHAQLNAVPDKDSISVKTVTERISSIFRPLDSSPTSADQQLRLDKISDNLGAAAEELALDVVLSAKAISMQPVRMTGSSAAEEQRSDQNVAEDERDGGLLSRPPEFTPSYFNPCITSSGNKLPPFPSSWNARKKRGLLERPVKPVSTAACFLLDEWQLGSDPDLHQYRHPYNDLTGGGLSSSSRLPSESNATSRRCSFMSSQPSSDALPSFQSRHPRMAPDTAQLSGLGPSSATPETENWSQLFETASAPQLPVAAQESQSIPSQQSAPHAMRASQRAKKKRRMGGF